MKAGKIEKSFNLTFISSSSFTLRGKFNFNKHNEKRTEGGAKRKSALFLSISKFPFIFLSFYFPILVKAMKLKFEAL